jgi:hypothetical protein
MKSLKNYKHLLFVLMAMCTIVSSCRKDDTIDNPSDLFDNFVQDNIAPDNLFTLNATTGGVVTCKRGTKITFPPNCFVNQNNSITTGDVLIVVKEALDKSQWLMNGLSTTTTNDILISGGMIDILVKRSSDGEELKPAPAMLIPTPSLVNVIKAEVPRINNRPDTLRLFLPIQAATASTPPTGWSASYYPFGNGANSYIFQVPQFRWVNCDGLGNQPGVKTTIKVTPDLSAVTGASGVQAMLVYRNLSTVITLPPSATFFQSYNSSIPTGSTADVVCIGKDGSGKIIFKVMPAITFTSLMNITIKPEVTDAATVKAYLNSL